MKSDKENKLDLMFHDIIAKIVAFNNIKKACWLYDIEYKRKNNNPIILDFKTFDSYTTIESLEEYVILGLIDCSKFGGKEEALKILKGWYYI